MVALKASRQMISKQMICLLIEKQMAYRLILFMVPPSHEQLYLWETGRQGPAAGGRQGGDDGSSAIT
jgi:hypothetical protein